MPRPSHFTREELSLEGQGVDCEAESLRLTRPALGRLLQVAVVVLRMAKTLQRQKKSY